MPSFANLSLSQRIGLIVLAGLVVGLGLFSWLGIQALNKSTERILNERLVISRMMATYLDESLNYVVVQTQNAADFTAGLPTAAQFDLTARSMTQLSSQTNIPVTRVFLIDASGQVLYTAPSDPGIVGANFAGQPEVQQTLTSGQPTISGLISNSLLHSPVEFITAPVLDSHGAVTGALISSVDIQQANVGVLNQVGVIGKTAYSEIVDSSGNVLARTKPGTPLAVGEKSDHPDRFADLIRRGEATVRTCHRCHESSETIQRRADVLAFAPLSNVSWGIAVRQAQEEALAPTAQLERQLLLIGIIILVITCLLVWGMMRGVVKPIKMLTTAAKSFASGDFKMAMPTKHDDEIGQLSTAFYTMVKELNRSKDELVTRNRELMALNSISTEINQSLDRKQLLESSLQEVLQVTQSNAVGIFLAEPGSGRLEIACEQGLSLIARCNQAGQVDSQCACHQVLRSGQTVMVNHVSQCALLDSSVKLDAALKCFVCVPLRCKDKNLGVMNIIYSEERSLTDNDFRLLDSIGYHIGLALENAELFEGLKQKEELRGKLLSSVISAQEEERKRIAREIHDEYGQTLAGLMINIESYQDMINPEQTNLKAKIETSKAVVTYALEEMRRLALDLRPPALDDLGLVAAIRAYARDRLEKVGIRVTIESEGVGKRLPPATEIAIFRILQEAIHNISKHAKAQNVFIKMKMSDILFEAMVEDDGQGFDMNSVKSRIGVKSLGLLGIRERTAILGGTFHLESQVGQGTRIKVEIPLSQYSVPVA